MYVYVFISWCTVDCNRKRADVLVHSYTELRTYTICRLACDRLITRRIFRLKPKELLGCLCVCVFVCVFRNLLSRKFSKGELDYDLGGFNKFYRRAGKIPSRKIHNCGSIRKKKAYIREVEVWKSFLFRFVHGKFLRGVFPSNEIKSPFF